MADRNRIVHHVRALAGPATAPDAADRDLMQSFVARHDEAAFGTLVRRHGPMVLGVCRRVLRNDADAEDAFQATFLVLAKKAAALRSAESLGSWLYGIAYRSALKARTALARRRARETAVEPRTAADPLAEMTVAEAQAAVDEELARLPDKFRAPIVLCCLEGLARDEAAEQLGWPVSLVKNRLEQARELLRRRLDARGLSLPAGLLALGTLTGAAAAAVPASLIATTAHAARLAAAGVALSTLVPAPIATLTEELMRSCVMTPLKIALAAGLLCLTLGVGTAGLLLGLRGDERPATRPVIADKSAPEPVALKPESLKKWGQSDAVVVGKLISAQAGPVGFSNPPLYTFRLQVQVGQVLRGPVKAGDNVQAGFSIRQKDAPTFPVGKECLVSLSKSRGAWTVLAVVPSSPEELAQAKLAAAVPVGWGADRGGRLVSPWAQLGKAAWPADARGKGTLACSVTGRPALTVGDAVEFTVEPVEPKVKMKYGNPDGDGEYKITVKNPTAKTVTVPALLSDGKTVLWKESLVIVCQGKTYAIPGAKGIATAAKPVTLGPGEAVSTTVNALALQGPTWPRGGYRIEFQFGLGEKNATRSFYYLSKHHDPIRAKAQAGP